jgi:hypothetical protein
MANTYTLITSSTVGAGGASSISFASIVGTYTDLCIKFSGRNSTGSLYVDDLKIVLNSDTNTARYSQRQIYGNSSTAASSSNTNLGCFAVFGLNGTSSTASTFSNTEVYIPNYAGSTQKSISVDASVEANDSAANHSSLALIAGLYNQTTAITQIDLSSYNGYNFAQYTTAYLYGVKNA